MALDNKFTYIPDGDHHVIVPINEADGKALQDIANGYRGGIEGNLTSHDGVTNVTLYFINDCEINCLVSISFKGIRSGQSTELA